MRHEQVAGGPPPRPGLALALEPDARAVLDAGRDLDRVALRAPLAARAVAVVARILDHGALAAGSAGTAARARTGPGSRRGRLGRCTPGRSLGAVPGFAPEPPHSRQAVLDLDRDPRLDPAQRVLEGQPHLRLEVGAAPPGGLAPAARANAAAAEEVAEDAAEVAEVEVARRRSSRRARRPARSPSRTRRTACASRGRRARRRRPGPP